MSAPVAGDTPLNSLSSDSSAARLEGRWLVAARVGWVALTVLVLSLNLLSLPHASAYLQSVCGPRLPCSGNPFTQADLHQIHQLGLTPGFLVAYQLWLDVGTMLIWMGLAALIVWRRSQERMALFCAYMLVLFGGATYTALLDIGIRTISPTWYVLVGGLELVAQVSFFTFFLLFPSGRFVPRWSWWLILVFTLFEVQDLFFPTTNQLVQLLTTLAFPASLLSQVGLQIYRYRRVSTFRERQQTKWVVFGLASALGGIALVVTLGLIFLPEDITNSFVFGLVLVTVTFSLLLLIPISIAIAIVRSQLYDIDTIINRTLVYSLLTGILGAIYAGLIVGLETIAGLFASQAGTNSVVLVVSTLAIFVLFLPVRRRVQTLIDRRFYRRKYDAEKALASFSAVLSGEIDLEQVRTQVLTIVQDTMQPTHASLWLRRQSDPQQGRRESLP